MSMLEEFLMSSARAVGSNIQVTLQTKFQTFTPDTFQRVLKEQGFSIATAQLSAPTGQLSQAQTFSKGDLIVLLGPSPNPQTPPPILFQILNMIDLKLTSDGTAMIDRIKEILTRLNIVPDVIASITFNCTTTVTTSQEPTKVLSSRLRPGVLKSMSKILGFPRLQLMTMRLGTEFPLEKHSLQVLLEPLVTAPKSQYYVNVIFTSDNQKDFNDFIRRFGEVVIDKIVKLLSKDA